MNTENLEARMERLAADPSADPEELRQALLDVMTFHRILATYVPLLNEAHGYVAELAAAHPERPELHAWMSKVRQGVPSS